MSQLSDLLNNRLHELKIKQSELGRLAKKRGETLSAGTVSNYLNGSHGKPSRATLRAFSVVLSIPIEELEDAASFTGFEPFEPHRDADLLTATQRDAVNQIIRLLAEGNKNASPSPTQEQGTPGEAVEGEKTPQPPLDRLGYSLAATTGQRALDEEDANANKRGEENQDT